MDQSSASYRIFMDSAPNKISANPTNPSQHHAYKITDFFSSIDQVEPQPTVPSPNKNRKNFCCQKLWTRLRIWYPEMWFVLILVGLFSSASAFLVEWSAATLHTAKLQFSSQTENPYLNFVIWLGYSLWFGFVAASCGEWISKDAEGSGIPELKSIMSGVSVTKYLGFQTLFAKMIGLIAATGGGLSVGREGPFVHIAWIWANKLTKFPWWRELYENQTLKMQVLAGAVAAGVVSTFGAPVGGILFSIEVTATYYAVNNLFKAFFCAIWCVIFYNALAMTEITDYIDVKHLGEVGLGSSEIFIFLLLGILTAFIGSLFVYVLSKLALLRRYSGIFWFENRYLYTLSAVVLCSAISFPTGFLKHGDKPVLNELLSPDALSFYDYDQWATPHVGVNLAIFVVAKFLMTVVSVSCPIPCGVFTPVFVMGAALGRLVGFVVNSTTGIDHMGVYAIVGAAAMTSSVTHTVSVAVIVFELTGQINYMIPLLIAVLTSFTISQGLTMSIFDVLLDLKSLPYLPALRSSDTYDKQAVDIMETDFTILTNDATLRDISIILEEDTNVLKVAIIDEQYNLVASVNILNLKTYLQNKYDEILPSLTTHAQKVLQAYFYRLSHMHEFEYNHVDVPFNRAHTLEGHTQNRGRRQRRLSSFISENIDLDYLQNLDVNEDDHDPHVLDFWSEEVDFDDPILAIDTAPLTVAESTSLSRVHFMFLMLGLSQLYITLRGRLSGMISRDTFAKYKHH